MGLNKGTVNIKGKNYKLVVQRVNDFRTKFVGYGMDTKIYDLGHETGYVVMETKIYSPEGKIIASGYAEEKRNSTMINKTSALENCETSSIGRALACLGLGGTEYSSADELVRALKEQDQIQSKAVIKKRNALPAPKEEPKKQEQSFVKKALNVFKPEPPSKEEVNQTFAGLIKAYGYKLDNDGVDSPIEGILKICNITTDPDQGGRDELFTLPYERKLEIIPKLKEVI
jgi:hypothetical protein